jgi:dCTP deaminase
MILSDGSLLKLLPTLIPNIEERDFSLINPASIDVRIGRRLLVEAQSEAGFRDVYLEVIASKHNPWTIQPGQFMLVDLYESIYVPNGYAVELKLKSSRAREGYNHSLAFWVDPGWNGYLTMEITNVRQYASLPLWTGMKFAQIIVHQLDQPAMKPYAGHYQNAQGVEPSKL